MPFRVFVNVIGIFTTFFSIYLDGWVREKESYVFFSSIYFHRDTQVDEKALHNLP
jgi:hypothetical protein